MSVVRVYIGIGSNLGGPRAQVEKALQSLQSLSVNGEFTASPLYQTTPTGPQDQPDFINAVAGFLTRLSAQDLLQALKVIENSQGRQRDGVRWGPRTLDLDLLLYGNESIDMDELTVPHPRIRERAFVMVPLFDVAPDISIPGQNDLQVLMKKVSREGVRKINANS